MHHFCLHVHRATKAKSTASQHTALKIRGFVERLPARCTPILCMDANAHICLVRGPGGDIIPSRSEEVGHSRVELQNCNGGSFVDLPSSQYLFAVNTHFDVGPMFYCPPPRRHKTRVDYIVEPTATLRNVRRCHIQYSAADMLQLISDTARRDHLPLQIDVEVGLSYERSPQMAKIMWDKTRLVDDALPCWKGVLVSAGGSTLAARI